LVPAYIVRGRITDPNDKPIPAATVTVRALTSNWITGLAPAVLTDANGVYEARAIPASQENLSPRIEVYAPRYAPTGCRDLPFAAAQNHRVEVKPIVLTPANRSISGVVVDANGLPAPGLPIFVSGSRGMSMAGQPRHESASDAQGRFVVEGVCPGPLRIQAGFGNPSRGPAMMEAQGGDRDLKLILGREEVHTRIKPLLGKPLPDWRDLIDLDPEQAKGKPILLCFFDLGQRPSRRCLDLLGKQAGDLQERGVIVVAIQAAATDETARKAWVKERGDKLPLGQIRKDVDKVKIAWGVQSLPWLILTDKDHTVRAEGFGPEELQNRVEAITSTGR
jgi:hypothetical protein